MGVAMKVFNIGLPKTGTTSFAAFLRSHGLRALHNPIQFRKHLLEGGDCRFDGLGHFDAISNFGEWRWGELAACWPGCKFVVTVRPFEAWIKSA